MKKTISFFIILCTLLLTSCSEGTKNAQVVATTRPVYDFTMHLCKDTGITVDLLVTESISCLHDYTLQVRQMRALEGAQVIVLSGAGLEGFLSDAISCVNSVIDASEGLTLLCDEHEHEHEGHHHEQDPHIWLSIKHARTMATNILQGLIKQFPGHSQKLEDNFKILSKKFDELDVYGQKTFSDLTCHDLITFHDGFGYFAEYWNLHIVHSLEEESGSEASAAELKELIELVNQYHLPAIFTEENGSTSAAQIIAKETGISVYALNMGMSEKDYFESMYHNIDTIKEALG